MELPKQPTRSSPRLSGAELFLFGILGAFMIVFTACAGYQVVPYADYFTWGSTEGLALGVLFACVLGRSFWALYFGYATAIAGSALLLSGDGVWLDSHLALNNALEHATFVMLSSFLAGCVYFVLNGLYRIGRRLYRRFSAARINRLLRKRAQMQRLRLT